MQRGITREKKRLKLHLISMCKSTPIVCFSIKLHGKTQVSGRLGLNPWTCPEPIIGQAKENDLNNPPCPITPTLTSSSVGLHHSSHQLTRRFYRTTL